MTGATGTYGDARDNFPMIEAGAVLTAAQVQLIAAALSQRTNARTPNAGAAEAGDPVLKTQFGCDGVACICSGPDDCNDMFGSGSCGDAMCFGDGAGGFVCICHQV